MKTNKTYYFSVEGETEVWYFNWLEAQINKLEDRLFNVKLDAKKYQSPTSRVKNLNNKRGINITHVIDVEGNTQIEIKKFDNVLDNMKRAEKLGEKIRYNLAYSNLSFELWLLLHKKNCFQSFSSNDSYLKLINATFDEKFVSLKEYKSEKNFKRLLNKIKLNDVKDAVNRSKKLEERNKLNDLQIRHHGKYSYFIDNPSTSVWEIVENIIKDCGVNLR